VAVEMEKQKAKEEKREVARARAVEVISILVIRIYGIDSSSHFPLVISLPKVYSFKKYCFAGR
jgi:hypothetical protein